MRPQPKHLLLVFAIISTISTLVSGSFTFAYWNEYTLEKAIDDGRVTAEIHGIAEDGSFQEPMLDVTLSKQTIWPLTVVIPQGLRLMTSEESEVIVQETASSTLFRSESTKLFAYSLNYHQGFPKSSSKYEISKIETNDELISRLDNIIALEFKDEVASQLAVWMTFNEVALEEIEEKLGVDFSSYAEEIKELIELVPPEPPPPAAFSELALWLAFTSVSCTFSFVSLGGLLLIWRKKPTLEGKPPPPKQLELEDWKPLTKGGMAEIWTAYDKRRGKKVIVKFPKTDIDTKNINEVTILIRFGLERTYHEMMDHENVVKLIESGDCYHPQTGRETEYLILEFIDGKTIHELISYHRYDQFRVDAMIEIVRQITNALTHIHQQEVVHRDITSKNIMVDQSGRVYLIDFGNAAEFDSKKTSKIRLQSVGTPPFYPPRDENVGTFPAYDYYSLAVLIYAMYSGKRVIGRSQEQIKEEIRKWYNDNSSEAPMVVRKALAWYLHGKYSDNKDESEQIQEEYFPSGRQILGELVQRKENEPNEPKPRACLPASPPIDSNSNHTDPNYRTESVNI